jgi:hypothetical protein
MLLRINNLKETSHFNEKQQEIASSDWQREGNGMEGELLSLGGTFILGFMPHWDL